MALPREYGSISHNTKAIYQRYMGWFDGNPAHLWEHPPEEQARRYVEFMGGATASCATAQAATTQKPTPASSSNAKRSTCSCPEPPTSASWPRAAA